jgi:hypothetical protein
MADINLKTLTPDATINDSAFLFGADSQATANPSVYAVSTLRGYIISVANTFTTTQTSTCNFAALNTNASTVITSTLLGAF